MKIKKSAGDIIADIIIYIFIGLLALICIIPLIHVLAVSVSGDAEVYANNVWLLPKSFNLDAYKIVINDPSMMRSLVYTIFITVLFTALGMFLTICAAYALSRDRLKGKKVFNVLLIITMYFSAGVIPEYLLIDRLNLLDTTASLVLPLAFSAYNMIILRTAMLALPKSLEEAAQIDGCNDFRILVQIMLPLCVPTLATLTLFYAVGRWNAFQDALYYIQSDELKPLQYKLYNLVNASGSTGALSQESGGAQQQSAEVVKSATIMFATIPIVIVYPFVQRYFVSGVMIGAVKG
ncbi:MAG: carbohydrate ABC transporter permease [bacterium]|nr:carbohydrate ABC transporter permease [bacterium]